MDKRDREIRYGYKQKSELRGIRNTQDIKSVEVREGRKKSKQTQTTNKYESKNREGNISANDNLLCADKAVELHRQRTNAKGHKHGSEILPRYAPGQDDYISCIRQSYV